MITHKFREVTAFADAVTVLRRGKRIGGGKVGELDHAGHGRMMIGDTPIRESATRKDDPHDAGRARLVGRSTPRTTRGCQPSTRVEPRPSHAGEIVGIAGVSGNGQ